jgi:hypothetical protein
LDVDAEWTISPGNTLIMAADTDLNVNGNEGAQIANATAAKPILVTGEEKTRGFWGAIAFTNAANPKNSMSYVTVEYAGSGNGQGETADVTLGGTGGAISLAMSHCTLQQSKGYGLSVSAHTTLPSFDANTFTKNTKGPVDINSEVTQLLLPNSTYTGNDVDQVTVHPNLLLADVTWQDLGVPYFIDGTMTVDKVWTIDPGVTLILAKDTGFHVPGDEAAIHAVGTSAKPILITGAQKTNGYWRGCVIDNSNSASNDFEYVTVEYGGGSIGEGDDVGELVLTADSHGAKVKVVNSTFQHSAQWAIYLDTNTGANADIDTANTFSDNASGNVFHAP